MSNDTLSVLLRLTQSYTALTRLTRLSLVSVSLTREGFPDGPLPSELKEGDDRTSMGMPRYAVTRCRVDG